MTSELQKIIDDIRLQLKLPIGYEGRSYETAVQDFDRLLRRTEEFLKRELKERRDDE